MRDGSAPFPVAVKRLLAAVFALSAAVVLAEDPPPPPAPQLGERAEKLIKEGLPVCAAAIKETRIALQHKLPVNLTGAVLRTESERGQCVGQWVALTSREGGFFLGVPWFLDNVTGTPEVKLRTFAWANMQQNFEVTVGKTPTREGFFPVTMNQITERGKMPMQGVIDPAGTVVFIGNFFPITSSYYESRVKAFQPYIDVSPTKGAAKPAVTVVEFSDFQCPSCKHAAGYLKPIMDKYGDQVRYVRYDLPLVMMHPWAFSAAVAGHAVYRQKPELFWEYKERVYGEQEKLSAFTFDEFARGFAEDHELDMKKYDADVSSAELQSTILAGAGMAFTGDIRGTPSYMINGAMVDPGADGKALETYVAGLLKK
jgi:protein-disulfide isomerase